jgi:predicted nucleic acid-binding protein
VKLVIDASTLVADGLRFRGRQRWAHLAPKLYLAEHAYDEARHELSKRFLILKTRNRLSKARSEELWRDILSCLELPFIVLGAGYQPFESVAKERLRDANDWPTLALALTLECGIWTQDYDFFGTGVATWSTENIERFLQRAKPVKAR